MSRVDEEREAARRAEKALQTKRQEEVRSKEQKLSGQKFSASLDKGHQQQNAQKKQAVVSQALGRSTIEQLIESSEADLAETSHKLKTGTNERAARNTKSQGQKGEQLSQQQKLGEQVQHSAELSEAATSEGREASLLNEFAAGREGSEGRKADARATRESVEAKREKADGLAATSKGFAPAQEKEGSDRQSNQDGKQGQASEDPSKTLEKFAALQMNPALRAPVPLAQPRQVATSERLRALAAEIAQKIVERVRVGQNASGMAEFQIELRSHVLSGLQINISGSKGKIKAVFSGHDRDVLKMLKEHEDSLKKALSSRGLTLAEFRIAERG